MNILRTPCNLKLKILMVNSLSNNYKLKSNLRHSTRQFSLRESIEQLAKTQTGIFQTISESYPVECMQSLLVKAHSTTGLPWWATIICTTIFLRSSITVPLAIYQQYILAKVEKVSMKMPEIAKELGKEVSVAVKLYNWDEKTAKVKFRSSMKKQWNKLIVEENCHPAKASLLLWFQIPLWISLSVGLRNLVYELPKSDFDAKVTFMELSVGGCAWFPNLIASDTSLILPVALGLINYSIIEVQSLSRTAKPSKFYNYVTYFFKGFSILMIPIAASVPSCLVLYWTTSSAYGLIQNIVLLSPKCKRFCKIPLTPSQNDKPYTHLYNAFKNKYIQRVS